MAANQVHHRHQIHDRWGPLCSAKARARIRRNRSVSSYTTKKFSTLSSSTSIRGSSSSSGINTEHRSRSKFRNGGAGGGTIPNRVKAISGDRANPVTPKFLLNTPVSVLRYPKFGETVISLDGSPIVEQGTPDLTPNVNIPIRNGVLSLRPTQMQQFDTDFIKQLDAQTLSQMRQLQTNLNMIMNYTNKS